MSFFKRRSNDKPKPLAQPEREAIIDLLHLCIYADAHIALEEGALIADVVETIGWDTNLAFGSYEAKSIAAARAAKDGPEAKAAFLGFVVERLPSADSRALALDLCKQLFSADGSTAEKEAALLAEIRAALK